MNDEPTTHLQPSPATPPSNSTRDRGRAIGRFAGLAGAGVIAGLMALGATSLAQAQYASTPPVPAEPTDEAPIDDEVPDEGQMPQDELLEDAVWDAFDTCLAEQGLDLDSLETAEDAGELSEADEDALDAAFEACDPILVEAFGEDFFDDEFDCDDEEEHEDGDLSDPDSNNDEDSEADEDNDPEAV